MSKLQTAGVLDCVIDLGSDNNSLQIEGAKRLSAKEETHANFLMISMTSVYARSAATTRTVDGAPESATDHVVSDIVGAVTPREARIRVFIMEARRGGPTAGDELEDGDTP